MKHTLAILSILLTAAAIGQEPTVTVAGVESKAAWDAPTENTDGTAATDIVGYDLALFSADHDPNSGFAPIVTLRTETLQVPLMDLGTIESGEYFLAVRAVDKAGNKSQYARLKFKMDKGVPLPPAGFKITFTLEP